MYAIRVALRKSGVKRLKQKTPEDHIKIQAPLNDINPITF